MRKTKLKITAQPARTIFSPLLELMKSLVPSEYTFPNRIARNFIYSQFFGPIPSSLTIPASLFSSPLFPSRVLICFHHHHHPQTSMKVMRDGNFKPLPAQYFPTFAYTYSSQKESFNPHHPHPQAISNQYY
jgi:hypothetical protein